MHNETWEIEELLVRPNFLGYQQLVTSVRWKFTMETNLGTSINTGWTELDFPYPGSSYLDYSSLTVQQIISWVQSTLGQDGLRNLRLQALGVIQSSLEQRPQEVRVTQFPWSV